MSNPEIQQGLEEYKESSCESVKYYRDLEDEALLKEYKQGQKEMKAPNKLHDKPLEGEMKIMKQELFDRGIEDRIDDEN